MERFFITYQTQVVTAIISFFVALFTTLLTHFLGNFKLRYTEKLKIANELSKRKYEGITKIRKEITVLASYENLSLTEDSLNTECICGDIFTPSCCYSYKNLVEIAVTLNDLRGEFGYCLRHKSVIFLVYINKFLFDYAITCSKFGITNDELRCISVPLFKDIHKWYKKLDKELISSMNKPNMKYFAHSGIKYNILLKLYGVYFKHTQPYKYLNDDRSTLNRILSNHDKFISQYKEEILKNEDETVS